MEYLHLGSQSIQMLLGSQTSTYTAVLYKYVLTERKRILTYNPIQNKWLTNKTFIIRTGYIIRLQNNKCIINLFWLTLLTFFHPSSMIDKSIIVLDYILHWLHTTLIICSEWISVTDWEKSDRRNHLHLWNLPKLSVESVSTYPPPPNASGLGVDKGLGGGIAKTADPKRGIFPIKWHHAQKWQPRERWWKGQTSVVISFVFPSNH